MMAFLRGVLAVSISVVLLIAALAVIGLSLLLGTTRGARLGVDLLADLTPGSLSVGQVQGSFLRGLRLVDVAFANEALEVQLALLTAEPALPDIVNGAPALRRLEAHGGVVTLRQPRTEGNQPEDGPLGAIDIPDELAVHAIALSDVILEGVGLPLNIVEVDARLFGPILLVDSFELEALDGTITGRGGASVEALAGYASLDYRDIDPALIQERLDGNLHGRLDLAVAAQPQLRVAGAGSTDGTLGGRPLEAHVQLHYSAQRLEIGAARARLDEGHIEVTGTVSETQADLRFTASLPHLDHWYPPAGGSITASGALQGEAENPAVDVRIDGRNLTWETGNPHIQTLSARVAGKLEEHALQLEARSDLGQISVDLAQGFSDGRLHGSVQQADIEVPRAGRWTLTSPAQYALTAAEQQLESACFVGPEQVRLCLQLADDTLRAQAREVSNALAAPWLPQNVQMTGAADVDAQVSWAHGLRGSLQARQPRLTVRATQESSAAASKQPTEEEESASAKASTPQSTLDAFAELTDIELGASFDEARLQAVLGARLAATGDVIDATLELAPLEPDGRLDARLTAQLTDLTLIDALLTDVQDLNGEIVAYLTAGGTPRRPLLDGTLTMRELDAAVPALGITVDRGRLTARAQRMNEAAFDGSLCSGGCVDFAGTVELPEEGGWRLEGSLQGEPFELIAMDDLRATVAPDLSLQLDPSLWQVGGSLTLVEGSMEVDTVPRSAIRPATETVVHGRARETVEAERLPAPLAIDVMVRLGDVRFAGLGIQAQLAGELDIERTLESRWLIEGTTTVEEGSFTAYGQVLTIESGQLIFTGSADNPALDIRATREVADAVVGLNITGTARDPRSVVFSNPAMSESEAFARLLTGRSLSSAGQADADTLEQAALGLGLRRALPSLSRLGENLGLDELGVDTPAGGGGAIVAGRHLGEDVYLRYRYGLFDDFAGLELIYRITERFRLRTETGTAQSIDLIYEVNRNGEGEIEPSSGFGTDGQNGTPPEALRPPPIDP